MGVLLICNYQTMLHIKNDFAAISVDIWFPISLPTSTWGHCFVGIETNSEIILRELYAYIYIQCFFDGFYRSSLE